MAEERRLRRFVLAWVLSGTVAVAASTAVAAVRGQLGPPLLVIVATLLVLAGNSLKVELPLASRTLAVDLTEVAIVLGLVLLPPPAIVLPAAVGAGVATLLLREPALQASFNTAVAAVSAAAAAVVAGAVSSAPLLVTDPAGLLAVTLAFLAYGVVNTVAAGALLARLDDTGFHLASRGIVSGAAVGSLLSGSLGIIAAVLLAAAPLAVPALLLPAWIAHRSLAERVARIREEVADRDRLGRTVEGASDGIALLDPDGVVELVNPALCRRLGVTTDALVGRRFQDELERRAPMGTDEVVATLAALTVAEPHGACDLHLDDQVFTVGLTALFDRLETRTGTVVLLLDVTEEREAQWLRRDLIARVSHELRTPLTSLSGFIETLLLRESALSASQRRQYLEVMDRQADRLGRLVSTLLWSARIERERITARVEAIRVADAATEALVGLAEVLTTTVEVTVGDAWVEADRDHLQQILINLLVNAATYGAPPLRLTAHEEGEVVVIEVSDGGPGVPEGFADQLFAPFAQASVGDRRTATGLGLGLSIVWALTEENRGTITYVRERGRSCFRVALPRAASGGR